MKFFSKSILAAAAAALGFGSVAQAAIVEVSADITADTRFTRDNVYVITKVVYVLPPAKLTVEPGTTIRAARADITGFTNSPGSIVVSRGAKLVGNGTADDPIVFTSLDDPFVPGGTKTIPATITGSSGSVSVTAQNYAIDGATSSNAFAYSKECGGIVLLGRTPIGYDRDGDANFLTWDGSAHGGVDAAGTVTTETIVYPTTFTTATGNGAGFALIEGLSNTTVTLGASFDADGAGSTFAASTSFNPGFFGGIDENDNSGVLRFWSHRYGGYNLAANNEINGLTMGGVGRGTVIEFQEVAQNADDGFEWFGGYVNNRYIASILNGDDCFDDDFGFSGNSQFLFAINDNESYNRSGWGNSTDGTSVGRNSFAVSDKMVESDGAEPDNTRVTPQTNHWAYNFTFIGNKGANVAPATNDSAIQLRLGSNGQWLRGISEDTPTNVFVVANSTTTPIDTKGDVIDTLYFNHTGVSTGTDADNTVGLTATAISQLRLKGHATKNGLDPRLIDNTSADSVARDDIGSDPTRSGVTGFFSPVRHRGAMRDNNWLSGWSWSDAVELINKSDDNVARPAVTLTIATTTVSISFAADTTETVAGDAVVYVVERSTDGKTFVPFASIQDGGASDTNATAGQITVADSGYTFTGSPVHYRVIPQ
jgi:plastocyanin